MTSRLELDETPYTPDTALAVCAIGRESLEAAIVAARAGDLERAHVYGRMGVRTVAQALTLCRTPPPRAVRR